MKVLHHSRPAATRTSRRGETAQRLRDNKETNKFLDILIHELTNLLRCSFSSRFYKRINHRRVRGAFLSALTSRAVMTLHFRRREPHLGTQWIAVTTQIQVYLAVL